MTYIIYLLYGMICLNIHTTKFNPKVVSIEILKRLNGFKVINMILGNLSYFKKPKFVLIFYKCTTLNKIYN